VNELGRARRTAEAVASARGLKVCIRPNLAEIDFGDWEAKSWSEIEAVNQREASRWLDDYPLRAAPNGESLAGFRARVTCEFRFLSEAALHKCIAVVTHAGFIRMALQLVAGLPFDSCWKHSLEYGSITEFKHLNSRWEVALHSPPGRLLAR
jgi:alpha-ribazole phosphatase